MMKTRSILRAGAAVLALSLAMPIPVQPAYAQSRAVPQSREQITLSFAPVVKQASPAVVNIYTRRTVRQRVSPFMDDPVFRRFFGESFSFGVPRERVEGSLGSGVIVAADGLVVTNAHVVKGSDEITVVLNDRREFPAKVETVDERVDLAVLRIEADGEKLPFLEFGESDDLEVEIGRAHV